jgi:hypothetical protein
MGSTHYNLILVNGLGFNLIPITRIRVIDVSEYINVVFRMV